MNNKKISFAENRVSGRTQEEISVVSTVDWYHRVDRGFEITQKYFSSLRFLFDIFSCSYSAAAFCLGLSSLINITVITFILLTLSNTFLLLLLLRLLVCDLNYSSSYSSIIIFTMWSVLYHFFLMWQSRADENGNRVEWRWWWRI